MALGESLMIDSFIKWVGGKSQLRKEIISLIPPHKTYVETFGGAGWVLFGKPPSPVEYLNDIDNGLINLYLVVRDHLDEFTDRLNGLPISETLFKVAIDDIPSGYLDGISTVSQGYTKMDLKGAEDAHGIPSVDDAVRLYYIIANAYNGKIAGHPSFSVNADRESSFVKFYSLDWQGIQNRLKRVTILNRDFGDILKLLDKPETFFYLDPPYICATDNRRYYRYTFTREDHSRLLVYLTELEGMFLLSYGNTPEIREMYSDFTILESSLMENELFILNYEPPEPPFYSPCSKGIPMEPGIPIQPDGVVYQGSRQRAVWSDPNCPECGGRFTKQLYERVTLKKGGRNWVPNGYTCKSCGTVFKIPVDH